ncbi:hypothetical protein [Vibrio ulleungensis]|jgi:hypothetical protein|uniref:Outer membrane protein beta-barrel domain-containing protein n=1 Tax=Vibrio ulleungensis TaxID=2807619 RepID=A0ABS2HLQ6_9VIBR|nr:hypothetical protein [Vibrio ulleungensis]MBM7038425.1 hypothetical protein [Vibrio ulleungensis]
MRKILIATLAIGTVFGTSAYAAEMPTTMSNFNYDYFDARIGMAPLTFGAGISKSIHPNAHFLASIDSKLDDDFNSKVGLGFHAPINNWADLTGLMALRVAATETHTTDTGMEINLGVRQWLGPQFEVGGNVGYLSIFDKEDVIGSVYGRFHATELFSIGFQGMINDIYDNQFMLTTRFNF